MPRFALFDALRGIAVTFIVTYHVAAVTGAINSPVAGRLMLTLGNQALILFFVISGFLLYRPFVSARAAGRPHPSLRRYGRHRVLRIVPGYWLALTVLAAYPGIVGVFTDDWWRYYGFSQLYSARTVGGGIPPAWSLSVEVSFYVALPVWALAIRRVPKRAGARTWVRTELAALGVVALAGTAAQLGAARQSIPALAAESLLGQSTWLALGMALAVLSVASERGDGAMRLTRWVTEHSALCWTGAAIALGTLAARVHASGLFGLILTLRSRQSALDTLISIALTAALASLLILPAVFGERAGGLPRRLLALRPLGRLGVISYAVYLWHLPVAHVLGLRSDPGHFSARGLGLTTGLPQEVSTPVLLALTLAVTAVLAAVSYRFVEGPLLRRKDRQPRSAD